MSAPRRRAAPRGGWAGAITRLIEADGRRADRLVAKPRVETLKTMLRRVVGWAGLAFATVSCSGVEAKPAHSAVIDSVVPRDSSLARFQRAVPRVSRLGGGDRSRDGLVRRFVAALERRDTVALGGLLITKSEFGWLYYPTNPEGLPPYNLTPQLMWFMLEGRSSQGLRKLVQQRAGKPLRLISHRCEGEPSRQADNTVWGPCLVLRRGEKGDTVSDRLFGQIVERGGRYKFVSYANKL